MLCVFIDAGCYITSYPRVFDLYCQSLMRVDEMAARSLSCSMTHSLNTLRITENVMRSQKFFLWKVQQSLHYSKFPQVRERQKVTNLLKEAVHWVILSSHL